MYLRVKRTVQLELFEKLATQHQKRSSAAGLAGWIIGKLLFNCCIGTQQQ
jgi:hypothetical protein